MATEIFGDISLSDDTALWTDSRNFADLNAVVNHFGATEAVIGINRTEVVTANLTIPASYTLIFFNEGKIQVNSGVTLTYETKDIKAPDHEIFQGPGHHQMPAGMLIRSSWISGISNMDRIKGKDGTASVMDGIIYISESEVINEDLTLSDAVNLCYLGWDSPGRELTISNTFTLNGVSGIIAGKFPIILGAGTVDFSNIKTAIPQWFNSFRECIIMIGLNDTTLIIDIVTAVDANLTITDNVAFHIYRGAGFNVSGSVILTIAGTVATYDDEWKQGAGTVTHTGALAGFYGTLATQDNIITLIDNEALLGNRIGQGGIYIGPTSIYDPGYDPSVGISDAADAQLDATQALADAAVAQSTADGKIILWRQEDPPIGVGESEGDLWINLTVGANYGKTYSYQTSAWTYDENNDLGQAITDAAAAQSTANLKTAAYTSLSSNVPATPQNGDVWYQTDTGIFLVWYANPAEWREDANATNALIDAAAAQASADVKTFTFDLPSGTPPTGQKNGDIWYETDTGKVYVWEGSNWVQDATATQALDDALDASVAAAGAQNTADTKTLVYFAVAAAPPGAPTTGDQWYQTDTKLLLVWNGSNWLDSATGSIVTYASSAPGSPAVGDMWFDTVTSILKIWDGALWEGAGDLTQTIIDGGLITTGSIIVSDSADANAGMSGKSTVGNDVRIWAGSNLAGKETAPFRIDQLGKLWATADSEFGIPTGTVENPTGKGMRWTQSGGLLEIFGTVVATTNMAAGTTTEVQFDDASLVDPGSADVIDDVVEFEHTFDVGLISGESIMMQFSGIGTQNTSGASASPSLGQKITIVEPDTTETEIDVVADLAISVTSAILSFDWVNFFLWDATQIGEHKVRFKISFNAAGQTVNARIYDARLLSSHIRR